VLVPGVRHRPGPPAACGGQVVGRRDQLPDRLSPAAYLNLDPTILLGLCPQCEEYDGHATVGRRPGGWAIASVADKSFLSYCIGYV
jgi:hypothetical protein